MGARLATPCIRRRGRSRLATTGIFVALTGLFTTLAGCGSTSSTDTDPTTASPTRSIEVEAGAVTVEFALRQLDGTGAVFEVVFDTHSVELDQDLAREAHLTVGDTPWPYAEWTGDGASGHHREGELRFAAGGPAIGTVTLTIDGLPEPVTATWETEELTDDQPTPT